MKLFKKDQQGFTIIEVMIVLAIAGIVMLIVFLAVPALQRSSRNTQRKTEIGRIATAVTEYTSNNNGRVPTVAANAGVTPASTILASVGTLGQYDFAGANNTRFTIVAFSSGTPAPITDNRDVRIVTGAICSTAGGGAVSEGTTRQISIMYAVETNGNNGNPVCQDI